MAWAPISTSASRWSASASSASSSAARAAIISSPSPARLIGLHPVQQRGGLAGVASRTVEQIDDDLAERGEAQAIDRLGTIEDDVVLAGGQRDVGPRLGAPQAETIGGA